MDDRRAVIAALTTAGISAPYRRKLIPPVQRFCETMQDIRGVVSLEVGFEPRGAKSTREFGIYPRDGVVHLVVVVDANDFEERIGNSAFLKIIREEDELQRNYPEVPIEFHIAPTGWFKKTKNSESIFTAIVPVAKHLKSIGKGWRFDDSD